MYPNVDMQNRIAKDFFFQLQQDVDLTNSCINPVRRETLQKCPSGDIHLVGMLYGSISRVQLDTGKSNVKTAANQIVSEVRSLVKEGEGCWETVDCQNILLSAWLSTL